MPKTLGCKLQFSFSINMLQIFHNTGGLGGPKTGNKQLIN